MLVLSRKKNESIIIHDDITITVVDIRGDKVRIGIDAPKQVPVHRKEVYDAIEREELEAARDRAILAIEQEQLNPISEAGDIGPGTGGIPL